MTTSTEDICSTLYCSVGLLHLLSAAEIEKIILKQSYMMSGVGDGEQRLEVDTFVVVGPITHSIRQEQIEIIEDHLILIQDGKITNVAPAQQLEIIKKEHGIADSEVLRLQPGEFLMPGMIDTHIHAPQYPNIGLGYDKTLLEWLTTYTYPLEKQYSDVEFANRVYEAVVRHSVACGTTTACYFATIHLQSSIMLANIVENVGQRGLVGKINMNINFPEGYGETTANSLKDTETFIKTIQEKGNDTILPVITPRFALSCDMDLMRRLADIARKYDVHIQTHISENVGEIASVMQLYPDCKNYADVYDKANLLTHKTILAHGVHLEDEELKLLATKGAAISHCPNSNTSLRSGLCNVRRLLLSGIKVGLGTDVSGGYSPSILDAMHNALDVAIHLSFKEENLQPLNYHEVFYLATLGGAQALALDHKIGNFVEGKEFDALVINMKPSNTPASDVRTFLSADFVREATRDELINHCKSCVGGLFSSRSSSLMWRDYEDLKTGKTQDVNVRDVIYMAASSWN